MFALSINYTRDSDYTAGLKLYTRTVAHTYFKTIDAHIRHNLTTRV